ncbi:hypothetical protein [Fischerella thermalis]|nr:hypothetical protein [Fischerella thermalis]
MSIFTENKLRSHLYYSDIRLLTLPDLEGVGFFFQPVNLSRGVSPPR